MNHTNENRITSNEIVSNAFARIIRFSGVATLSIGLILFLFWFGASMNAYLGNIASHSTSAHGASSIVGTVAAQVVSNIR